MLNWLKKYWPALVLSCALILIVDGTISSLETCHPPNSASGGQNSNENCTVLQGPLLSLIIGISNFIGDHDKGIIAAFTIVLALSTIGLWTATYHLWGVTRDTLTHAEETSKKELRAYISIEPRGITEYIGGDILIGHIRIRNIGKIPARNVSISSTIELDEDGRRTKFLVDDFRASSTVLQPRATMDFGTYKGWPIPKEQIATMEPLRLKGFLYVWGRVQHADELGADRWTTFCHRYPCRMFGKSFREYVDARARNRSIHRRYARYHEEGGNEAS